MAKEEKKAPKLRFNGYTNNWERKKLGIYVPITMGQSPNSKNYTSNPRDNILVQGNADLYNNRVLKRTFTTEVTKTADKDDILMSVRAPVGDIARNQYESIVIGRGIAAIKGNNFLYYQLEKMNNSGFWKKYIAGSTFESINGKDLKSSDIYISNYKEEKSIGNIFQTLTKTIQLHENYLQLLYNFRSFLLQKMFSINDTFPNLRFKQFNDKWKYKKLGEVADIVSGGTPDTTKRDYWNGSINWYTPAEVGNKIFVGGSQRKITNIGLENSSAKILPVGTVLFTSRAGIGKTAILKEKGSTNQGFQSIVPKKKSLDSYFIFSMSNILKKYGESHGAGSTFLEISGKELAKARISLPSITEQKNISKVLFKLDTIITLQKQEIDNLKKLKQFLLQNMFI
ncbi:restriction endonuclease subunit S [Ligilactobacillus salivarius]|uniref:restriction endonuclease subunit S n=1 Tax=Ligilactobacillus salivarius TaxID=1624 RepID=UPI001CBCE89E|nr:restriction endonuclease subunit S [Ligilactobacillus salivarius]MBZ4030953.1 restriction endonuclease subunit S [Ligilactobacillus salivarius]